MEKQIIPIAELGLQPFTNFDPLGALLVCGEGPADANPMTISWGTFGIMWGRPIMMVMVRPVRHTWTFINHLPDFTVNWFGEEWGEALRICGSTSGRDGDKFAATGLTPVASGSVQTPSIKQSILTLECRIIYRDVVKPELFIDPTLEKNYPQQDYHQLFYGEIVAATGVAQKG